MKDKVYYHGDVTQWHCKEAICESHAQVYNRAKIAVTGGDPKLVPRMPSPRILPKAQQALVALSGHLGLRTGTPDA